MFISPPKQFKSIFPDMFKGMSSSFFSMENERMMSVKIWDTNGKVAHNVKCDIEKLENLYKAL